MRRIAITLTALFALSLLAATPALAQNFGNCGPDHHHRNFNRYGGGYNRVYSNYNPGSVGYFAVPGRVVVGYRSVGGLGGYNPYINNGYNSYNNYGGFGTYGSGYGGFGTYNGGNPGFGFYFGN